MRSIITDSSGLSGGPISVAIGETEAGGGRDIFEASDLAALRGGTGEAGLWSLLFDPTGQRTSGEAGFSGKLISYWNNQINLTIK